jgi:hypothetical protein
MQVNGESLGDFVRTCVNGYLYLDFYDDFFVYFPQNKEIPPASW